MYVWEGKYCCLEFKEDKQKKGNFKGKSYIKETWRKACKGGREKGRKEGEERKEKRDKFVRKILILLCVNVFFKN